MKELLGFQVDEVATALWYVTKNYPTLCTLEALIRQPKLKQQYIFPTLFGQPCYFSFIY